MVLVCNVPFSSSVPILTNKLRETKCRGSRHYLIMRLNSGWVVAWRIMEKHVKTGKCQLKCFHVYPFPRRITYHPFFTQCIWRRSTVIFRAKYTNASAHAHTHTHSTYTHTHIHIDSSTWCNQLQFYLIFSTHLEDIDR